VNSSSSNQALHPTPEAGTFLANAILEQNFSFAKSSLLCQSIAKETLLNE